MSGPLHASTPFRDALSLCKAICRNGFDAYVVNPQLQEEVIRLTGRQEVDIVADACLDDLLKILPEAQAPDENHLTAIVDQGGVRFRFYPEEMAECSHPEAAVAQLTPRIVKSLEQAGAPALELACPWLPRVADPNEGFADMADGVIRLAGMPDETLRRNYLLSVRAIRFAANFNLPIEPNTWLAIVRSARRVLDYVSISDIMDEWRKVEAENLSQFAALMYDAQILHGLMPEVAALTRVKQTSEDGGEEVTVLQHTFDSMRCYPEELPYDWFGCMALLFHGVGKLYTAQVAGGEWHFSQYADVGAKITRKILTRMRFSPEDTDLICHLVRHHHRFSYMLSDKGIRRFRALDEYPRLIEMARARLKAMRGSYKSFNHNLKLLERADVPEEMLEPLLNGNEIMDFTGLKPGPQVGVLRDQLLQAQIRGDVQSVPEAVEFVRQYVGKEKLG